MWLWCNGKDGDFLLLVCFCICTSICTKGPCQQIMEMKWIKGECWEGWNSPVWGICSCLFLGASCVPCVKVRVRSRGGSVWLFIPWGLGFLCKVWGYLCSFFSHVVSSLASVNHHRWVRFFWLVAGTNACVGSSGSFLCIVFVCVRYIMCTHDTWCMHRVRIVSGVFSLLLYVDRKKRFIIFILSQHSHKKKYAPNQSCWCSWLASTSQCHWSQILPWIY